MKNEKTVTLKLTRSEFGNLFDAYLYRIDGVLSSPDLSDEDKSGLLDDLEPVGLVLWSALPAFVPMHSLRSLKEINWWIDDEQKA